MIPERMREREMNDKIFRIIAEWGYTASFSLSNAPSDFSVYSYSAQRLFC